MKSTRFDSFRFLIPLTAAVLLVGRPVHGQDKAGDIDEIFSWATPATPGCAVAVSQRGTLILSRGYGSADLERDVPIGPGTIFDAGSLTKQFVAAAVLLLVEEERLTLSDDVRAFIPELPDYGHKITVDHLLTHTSGLRDWTGILPLTAGKVDALTVVLRQRGLNFAPGEEWGYSNSGFVLAKEIVARTSGVSFAEFTRTRLFEPLGMASTSYREDLREVIKNRALAYDKEGDRWKMSMLLDDDRGGGGVFSTAGDLVIWNEALTNGRLAAFVSEKLQEPTRLNNGRKLGYGRGLFLDTYRGTSEVWHTGSADGYKSWLGRYPEHGLSIAIMCNSGDGTDRTAFAQRIFDLLVPEAEAPGAEAAAPAATAGGAPTPDLSGRAGLYVSERTGELLRLAVDRGRLRVAGGPPLESLAEDRFRRVGAFVQFMSGDEFEVHFLPEDRLELKSMEGQTTRYRRAEPYAPAPNDLEAFAGRYESDEMGAVFRIEPQGEGLAVSLEHAPARSLAFKPVDRDAFQWSRMTVRFARDESGNVTAFDYSNPLLRNIRFTRLGDRQ